MKDKKTIIRISYGKIQLKMQQIILVLGWITVIAGVPDATLLTNRSFRGFKVIRALPQHMADVERIRGMMNQPIYDFWTEVILNKPVDIMVPPTHTEEIENNFVKEGIQFEILIQDIQRLIELERIPAKSVNDASEAHNMPWTEYHDLDVIYSFLDYLALNYSFVTTESIGTSFEGVDMRVAKVCKGGCGNKPSVWIDGGIHAREWISPATVTWMLRELVENDQDHPDLTEGLDWYFLPSHNPDGYAFSRTSNRMWRKTRSDLNSSEGCMGVDANRNWGFHWDEGGSRHDECSDLYLGPAAFSEIENVNVRNYVMKRKGDWVFYNTIHSYSQLVLLPWGYTEDLPVDYEEQYLYSVKAAQALAEVHGETYEVGCIPCMLYIASGNSVDWAYGEAGIKFSMSMELRDTGTNGFLLPPDQIIPTAEEVWAFHLTFLRDILETYSSKSFTPFL